MKVHDNRKDFILLIITSLCFYVINYLYSIAINIKINIREINLLFMQIYRCIFEM